MFQDYELLANSGLFDAAYYLGANPDVAALNVDPLVHYLETGCLEGRNPSPDFNTAYYLSQCQALGEAPTNALWHFLTVGAGRGLRVLPPPANGNGASLVYPSSGSAAPAPIRVPREAQRRHERLLAIDVPKCVDGLADMAMHGGLSIVGWALAREGVATVEVALNGQRAAVANYGIRRPDVAAVHVDWDGSLQSGYAAHIPRRVLTAGRHTVTVTVRDRAGGASSLDFAIEVSGFAEDHGPWSLRRKMRQVEANLQLALLSRLEWRPFFRVLLALDADDIALTEARRSLESLSRQTYADWQLCLLPTAAMTRAAPTGGAPPAALIEGFEDCATHVMVVAEASGVKLAKPRNPPKASGAPVYILSIAPGDEFGCDALLEFALASGVDREADFLYCDERRLSPVDGKVAAFFKPQWSPDLLLSTNYIGRSWCAHARLLERCGISMKELGVRSDYDVALRLTESARDIRHTAKLLFQQAAGCADSKAEEVQALTDALARRRIAGVIQPGCAQRYYRVKRRISKPRRVSIIVPTCAAGGRIKICIETLRALTSYRDYEIVCIENIPAERRKWKRWLGKNADIVIETDEPFNWSRYNNIAAARAGGKYLLFLNDDTEIIEPDWLEALLEHAQRPEVGVVGAQLVYPDCTVQHAGVVLDHAGRGRHAFRHQVQNDPGYFGMARTQRNVISVTGACLLTRRDTFERLGGFQEAHTIVNGDLDYCLKSWRAGLLNIYTPYAQLIHHELASRAQLEDRYDSRVFWDHWHQVVALGDPYFNPHLSLENNQVAIDPEPVEEIYAGQPLFAAQSVHRILVIKLDHIGDCITALPAVRRLRRLFPDAKITVLAARATLSIWQAEPSVDDTVEFNFFHARSGLGVIKMGEKELVTLGESLRPRRFDLAIDLRKQPDTRQVLQHSGARILVGFDHQGRFPWLDVALEWDEDVPLRTKRTHVTNDLRSLIDAVAVNSQEERRALEPPKEALSMERAQARRLFSRPVVCVHPAAGSEMRQWPLGKFSELIDLLLSQGELNIAIIGAADEQPAAAEVLKHVAGSPRIFNLVGQLSLAELPKILARAALFVGNNSGPQHLAAGLGVPTIGIHSGVVDAREWGPSGPNGVAIRRHMSCSPCFVEHRKDCPRALACLTQLESHEVFSRCMRLLALGVQQRARTERALVSLG
jgi:ADP-heptose:LPS heptosyltransferase/GT2 family glycosyltransferase